MRCYQNVAKEPARAYLQCGWDAEPGTGFCLRHPQPVTGLPLNELREGMQVLQIVIDLTEKRLGNKVDLVVVKQAMGCFWSALSQSTKPPPRDLSA